MQVSVLKIKEWDVIRWAVIVSESGKPNNTYCIYNSEEIARSNAGTLACELNAGLSL
jgi:hypothetical protein